MIETENTYIMLKTDIFLGYILYHWPRICICHTQASLPIERKQKISGIPEPLVI